MSWNHGLFKNQKGVFLVFTAILLPIIFACAGLAMDLGNAFAHKSKLQNAADAAALAGAKTFAVNNETIDKHPIADAMAVGYANTNYQKEIIETHRKLQSQTKDGKTYYRVYLKDYVPVTFMRILGVGPTMEVSVEAIATIPNTPPPSGGKLFNIGSNIYGSFYNGNNDQNSTVRGPTFDGDVVIYDQNKYNEYKNNTNYYFYKSEAAGMKVTEAIKQGLYTTPTLASDTGKDYNTEKNKIDNEIKSLFNEHKSEVINVNAGDSHYYIPGNNSAASYYQISGGNLNLHISNPTGSDADKDKPVYVYITEIRYSCNIQLESNITRPVIIYYNGTTNIHFNNPWNLDYRGVLCTPNASISPFQVENSKFSGSVWANTLELNTNHGKFNFEGFGNGVFGGSGSGGGSTGGEEVKLKLVDGSGLNWN